MHVTVAGKQVETGDALKTHVRDGLDAISISVAVVVFTTSAINWWLMVSSVSCDWW